MLVIQRRFKNVFLQDTEVSPTLESAMGNGGGNIPIIMEIISIDRAAFNQGENAKYDFSISGGGTLKH